MECNSFGLCSFGHRTLCSELPIFQKNYYQKKFFYKKKIIEKRLQFNTFLKEVWFLTKILLGVQE